MNIQQAMEIIREQRLSFRKVSGLRWLHGKYEYRLTYEGGFGEFFALDRREIGRRKFNYWHGFGASGMRNNSEVIAHINKLFPKEVIS